MLEVKKVEAKYGNAQVLWDINLHVEQGEVVALIGSNGAGKTTTLKSIVGLVESIEGEVTFLGEAITKSKGHVMSAKGIAYVPEGRRVFPELSVYDNLILGAFNDRARKKRNQLLQDVYDFFPRLKERENQHAGTLSGGEQQMLAIGRGLMSDPKLLLLDEPSLGIAPILVQEIFKRIKTISEAGKTILIVEQQVQYALNLANRSYVLENGRIVTSGSSSELLNSTDIREAYLGI